MPRSPAADSSVRPGALPTSPRIVRACHLHRPPASIAWLPRLIRTSRRCARRLSATTRTDGMARRRTARTIQIRKSRASPRTSWERKCGASNCGWVRRPWVSISLWDGICRCGQSQQSVLTVLSFVALLGQCRSPLGVSFVYREEMLDEYFTT